jgi:thymidylate synthase (FAD)
MKAELIPSLCAGTDLDVANAARRSFNTQHEALTDKDRGLIGFLAREGHMLPFRHPQLSFACDAPVYVARQLGKHQVGMSWSEVSRRYKTEGLAYHKIEQFRFDHANRKQGEGPPMPGWQNAEWKIRQDVHWDNCMELYENALADGMTPEQARGFLPQSMEVIWTWTGSLLAWAHLWKLRNHKDTQKETRDFVAMLAPQIAERLPVSWAALTGDAA